MAKRQIFNFTFTPGSANVGTVVVPTQISQRRLLIITNVTDGIIIYNFADPNKGAAQSYSISNDETTFTLEFDTSAMSANDELQIFYEDDYSQFVPALNFRDPVDKMRVSNPQSLIDTDFEYSLQPFKWETLELVNNRPSIFNKANEPFLSSEQIDSITVSSFGVAGSELTAASYYSDPGTSGLTQDNSAINGDDRGIVLTLPFTLTLDNVQYNYVWVHSNSFLSFLQTPFAPSYSAYSARSNSPGAKTLFIAAGDYPNTPDTRAQILYYGTVTDANYGGSVFRIRWDGSEAWNQFSNDRQWELNIPQNDPNRVIIQLHDVDYGDNTGLYPTRQFIAVSDGLGNWLTQFYYNTDYNTGDAFQYGGGGVTSAQATVTTTSSHGKSVGDPILTKESLNTEQIDGAYIISNVSSTTEFSYLIANPTGFQLSPLSGQYTQTSGDAYMTVTANTHGYTIGTSVFLNSTSDNALDGIYEVLPEPAPTENTFAIASPDTTARTGNHDVTENFRGSYTAIYSGGFFKNATISATSITEVNNTARAKITFTNPHGLFVGTPIYVIDNSQPTADHIGGFTVNRVLSDTEVEYATRSGGYTSSSSLSSSPIIYIRPEGNAEHRIFDGGVGITPSTNSPNAQIIRQTKKYFRYQSGKGIQFSTGVLFLPKYDVNNVNVNVSGSGGSAETFVEIETDQEHGFVAPISGRIISPNVRVTGFSVTSGSNVYNGNHTIFAVTDKKRFIIKIVGSPPTDISPGGDAFVETRDWTDATVRTGMFDEQNGMFFEHDGQYLWAVLRSATFQLRGTVTAITQSPVIYGNKTKFLSTLQEGDYVNIRGMSHLVTKIISDTEMQVSPEYRGEINITNTTITKVSETRVRQDSFNIDKMDGSGPSGYLFDQNKMQMVYIDYSWYGAGKVRWGMRVTDGSIGYIHELANNNINSEAYMRTGNLPGRFEIQNTSKRTRIASGSVTSSAATSSYGGSFVTTITITLNTHGLFTGDNVIISSSSDLGVIPNGAYEIQSTPSTNTFTVQVSGARDAATPTMNVELALRSAQTPNFNLDVADTTSFPSTGVIMINNEYLRYTTVDADTLQINERNLFGKTNLANAIVNDNVYSVNQNFAPALSHWGTSVIMDGEFTEDKSFLFTALNDSYISVASSATVPLVSLRLAPSVDYGIARGFGIRNLINRSQLTLQTVGITAQRTFLITCKLNSEATAFEDEDNWEPAGNGSIGQYFDHSAIASTLLGGDTIFEFFTDDGQTRFATTEKELNVVRELGNSILGGNNIFPDGPDILTVFCTNISASSGQIRGRVSWSEAQG